ncbi:hypothetical protein [Legionella quateirensis]|uniref:Uncharacterized protein n=1 Tax=Legionella quateirensis TaxID=45072 RepID=A0A378KQS7_9GAMM|nr:hypothetical protein [Legionella quateirensis]KTD54753.1 hypothetical protein Lqua_0260 [Legionella quateirensis]STY16933.1 Uncharacterised protein [Legionella quateirensis]
MSGTHSTDKSKRTTVPVFTQLCAKANFSLFGNTLTIYPKLNGVTLGVFDPRADTANRELNEAWPRLGSKYCIHHNHPKHGQLHQDNFTRENWHTHVEFVEVIDENKLTQILKEFVQVTFITEQEKNRFIKTYKQANQLSQADFDKLMANKYLKQLKKSIQNNDTFRKNDTLMNQMNTVLTHFADLIQAEEDLPKVQRYIKETQLIIDNPTKSNIENLMDIATKEKGNSSSLWHALNLSLMLLGIALCAAGILITVSSCGTSLAPGIGLALIGLGMFSTGAMNARPVSKNELSKEGISHDLTHLSQLMNESFDESVPGGFVAKPA